MNNKYHLDIPNIVFKQGFCQDSEAANEYYSFFFFFLIHSSIKDDLSFEFKVSETFVHFSLVPVVLCLKVKSAESLYITLGPRLTVGLKC